MYSPKTNCAGPVLLLVATLLLSVLSYAQVIKGIVTDAKTGEAMAGATVVLKETGKKQFVPLDGSFVFKNVAPGDYELEISYTNYKLHSEKVNVSSGQVTQVKIVLEPKTTELLEITVVGARAEAERNTRNQERNSNQLVNVVSAKTIELSPDITVANVVQRVSGVTIERNSSGEARYPIIRGMEKRY